MKRTSNFVYVLEGAALVALLSHVWGEVIYDAGCRDGYKKGHREGYYDGQKTSAFIEITKEEAGRIFEDIYHAPKACYWLYEDNGYVGIDNRTHEAWTEEFDTKEECFAWLASKD